MVNASHPDHGAKHPLGKSAGASATISRPSANAVNPARCVQTCGCVKATFRVLDDLDPKYRQGAASGNMTHGYAPVAARLFKATVFAMPVAWRSGLCVPGRKLMEDDGYLMPKRGFRDERSPVLHPQPSTITGLHPVSRRR